MAEQIELSEFIARLTHLYQTLDDDKLRLVLHSTVDILNTLSFQPKRDLSKDQRQQMMALVLQMLGKLPGNTIVHRSIVKKVDPQEICCSEWPIQCGPACP